MEQTEEIKMTCTEVKHHFLCDMCGKNLGSTREYDNGYYDKLGEYTQQICINQTWYRIRSILCDTCAKKKTGTIIKELIELGFNEEY